MTASEPMPAAPRRPSRLQAPMAWLLGLAALALVVYGGMAGIGKRAREAERSAVPALIEALKGTEAQPARDAYDALGVLPQEFLHELVPYVASREKTPLPRAVPWVPSGPAGSARTNATLGHIIRTILARRLGRDPSDLSHLSSAADWEAAWDDLYAHRPESAGGQGR